MLLQKKKFAEAEAQLRDAVKKNDNAFTAHLYFGITLIHFKKYAEAETELRKAIALGGPKASQAHYYLGGVYWQTGNYRQAADELETYLKLEPKAAKRGKGEEHDQGVARRSRNTGSSRLTSIFQIEQVSEFLFLGAQVTRCVFG